MIAGDEGVRFRAFTLLYAFAACLHLFGNGGAGIGAVALVCAGAALVALRPADRRVLAVLVAGVVVTWWQESPDTGNHWLLAAFVGVAALAARRTLAPVRASYLAFYAFAAFAKLNSAFFDPSVSCAGAYLGDVAGAVGLGGLDLPDREGVVVAAAVATAAIELSVPVLLLRRSTRTVGVVVAVLFHLVVALPRGHQFYDFSSILLAGWATFLPADLLRRVATAVGSRVSSPAVLRAAGVLVAVLTAVVAAGAVDGRWPRGRAIEVGWWLWQPLSVAAAGVVVAWAWRDRRGVDVPLRPPLGLGAVVAALVVVNGVLPYLEVKTGAGWNMYANLRTAGGETNHLLVPRTVPLTNPQDDLVEIVATEDPVLGLYRDRGLALPVRTMRAYLQSHGDVAATLRVGGQVVDVAAGEGVPERLGPEVPWWVEDFFVLRAVDTGEPEQCQQSILPAR